MIVGLLTDTHCHLNLTIFQDELAQVLDRARERGLGRILVPGIDVETSQRAVEMAQQIPELYAAVGFHPSEAERWDETVIPSLRELARRPKVVAIGEIGLDYYRDSSPHPLQREIFRAQLRLASELNLPVVVHNRESFDDLWAEITDWRQALDQAGSPLAKRPGVLHAFDGTPERAQCAIEKGFLIGIGGPVTFKNARERQELAAGLPLNKILIETDAPYLTPQPFRGRWPNEPAYVAYVADKLAELHAQPLEVITRATWENAAQLFDWE